MTARRWSTIVLVAAAAATVALATPSPSRGQPPCPGTKVRYQDRCLYTDEVAALRPRVVRPRQPPAPPRLELEGPTGPAPAMFREVAAAFAPLIDGGRLGLDVREARMILWLPSDYLFEGRGATPTPHGRAALAAVATVVAGLQQRGTGFAVAAHTDNTPAPAGRFHRGRDLAAAQALAVVDLLADAGADPGRLLPVAWGDQDPVRSNDTPAGRARNRRIELEALPPIAALVATATAPAAAAQVGRALGSDHLPIELRHDRVVLRLPGEITFAPGRAALSKAARQTIVEVATALRALPYTVRVVGHVSARSSRGARRASQGALGMARAFVVADALTAGGVARVVGASMGALDPVADEPAAAARRRDDRVDIELVPLLGALPAPAP